jgi:uncharacterized phage infection (PIP) family protein YhgE
MDEAAVSRVLDEKLENFEQKVEQKLENLEQRLDQKFERKLERLEQKVEQKLESLEQRLDQKVEQKLGNLEQRLDQNFERKLDEKLKDYPTRQELRETIATAVAPLATKQELAEAVAPLATKRELKDAISDAVAGLEATIDARSGELKHHMGMIAEALQDQIKVVADSVIALGERVDRNTEETRRWLSRHDRQLDGLDIRVTKLETGAGLEPG